MQAHFKEVQTRLAGNQENIVRQRNMKMLYERAVAIRREPLIPLPVDAMRLGDHMFSGKKAKSVSIDRSLYAYNFVGVEQSVGAFKLLGSSPRVLIRIETFSHMTDELEDRKLFIIDSHGKVFRWAERIPLDETPEYDVSALSIPADAQEFDLISEAAETVLRRGASS